MIGEALKQAIRESGRSVNSIAREAGIPQPSLHYFLRGERGLSLETAEKLAQLFGLEVREKKRTGERLRTDSRVRGRARQRLEAGQ